MSQLDQNPTGDRIEGTIGDNVDLASVGKGNTQQSSRTGDVHVHVGGRVDQREPQGTMTLSMTVEEELRRKFIEHELKLEKLSFLIERNDISAKDYIRDLQEDVQEMKNELKPLVGMGIPSRSESKGSPIWLSFVSMGGIWLIGVCLLIIVILLATSGRF
jgi:hypothetical protein